MREKWIRSSVGILVYIGSWNLEKSTKQVEDDGWILDKDEREREMMRLPLLRKYRGLCALQFIFSFSFSFFPIPRSRDFTFFFLLIMIEFLSCFIQF